MFPIAVAAGTLKPANAKISTVLVQVPLHRRIAAGHSDPHKYRQDHPQVDPPPTHGCLPSA